MVRAKRLELIRLSTPDPKSGASAIPPRPHNRDSAVIAVCDNQRKILYPNLQRLSIPFFKFFGIFFERPFKASQTVLSAQC